jgi:hypothetical protein
VLLGRADRPAALFFDPKLIPVPGRSTSARVLLRVSGHGSTGNTDKAAEFLPLGRTLTINGRPMQNTLWTDDNDLNPIRRQRGPWKFDRAGWGPGRLVEGWSIPVTGIANVKELTLDYAPAVYVNDSTTSTDPPTHWVEGQVFFYAE